MNKPSISIIIPVYNVEPYVEDCIRSVMRQTYTGPMECIVVDDCSTDNSIAVVGGAVSEYNGPIAFKVLHHEHNLGLSAARNTGTLQATGDYLYYIDSDDEITESCIETLVGKVLEYPDVEMVQGNVIHHITTKESVVLIKKIKSIVAKTNAEARNCYYKYRQMNVNVWNKLIRRDFVMEHELFCKEGVLYEDQLWTFYLMKYLSKVAYEQKVTYHWKRRPFSITTGTDDKTKSIHYNIIYNDILNNLTEGYEKEEFDYVAKSICNLFVRFGHLAPGFKDLLKLCWQKNKLYGNRIISLLLVISNVLGRFKYGWVLWSVVILLKHPYRIPSTIRRLWNRGFLNT